VGGAGAVACLMGIVATHSRGGTIGLGVAVLAWALLSKRKGWALAAAGVAAAGLLILAPSSFWSRNETITAYGEDGSVHGRVQAWHVAKRAIAEHPIVGIGEQAFLAAWDHYAPLDAGHDRYVAHNLFLEVLAELGLLGFFGLVVFLGITLWSGWKCRNGPMGVEARALLASMLGYLVCQQFSGYSLSWFLYALCGFAAAIDHWGTQAADQRAPGTAPPLPVLGILRPGV
jgi:O-antigen ligase